MGIVILLLTVALSGLCHAESHAHAGDSVITAIRIDIVAHPDPRGEIQDLVQKRLLLKEGDPFSPEKLEASIRALSKTERFEAIHVDSREGGGQFELHLKITPYPLIKDIRVRQAYPVFERDILKVMSLSIGNPLRQEQLPRQTEAIVQLYRKEGFIAPMVDVLAEIDPADGNANLNIRPDKGPHYRVQRLNVTGNRSLSDFQLRRHMQTWRRSLARRIHGRFIEKELKEDIKKLLHLYRKKGYAETRIHYQLTHDKPTRSVRIDIDIDEGPLYRIEFEGNQAFSTRTLTKDLVLFTKGNIRNRGERISREKIEKRYLAAGFQDAKVRIESEIMEENDRQFRVIRFIIREGPQTVVQDVQIIGNRALATEALKANILTRPTGWRSDGHFSSQDLTDDVEAVLFQYADNGFLNPDIRVEKQFDSNRERVIITFRINEGVQTRVGGVTFDGLTVITGQKALEDMTLKPGLPFREHMIPGDENRLKALVAAQGYPHVKIESEHSLTPDHSMATIHYRIDEGPLVRLGDIFYQGNFKTDRKVMEREWRLAPGDPLDPHRLLESQKNIRNLGIFSTVQYRAMGFQEKKENIDLLVALEERKPYLFEVSGGYESDRRLFISSMVMDRNLFGMNRRGWLSGELSEIGYRLESGIRDPRLIGTRVALNFHGFLEQSERFNQDFGIRKAGATLGFELDPDQRMTTGLNLKYEYLNQYTIDSGDASLDPPESEQEDPRNVFVLTPRIQFDTRDSFIWPRKGIFSLGYIDLSRGLQNDLDDFLRYYLDLRGFWTPVERLTVALIGRGGYLDPYNRSGNVPRDQLFYLGGGTDIRGFEQNAMVTDENGDAVGGQKSLYGSVEVRIDLGAGWELPLFIDTGWLGGIQEPDIVSDVRVTGGSGLRYITPIGPIGILYGYKLDRKSGESAGAFHFSLGYTF